MSVKFKWKVINVVRHNLYKYKRSPRLSPMGYFGTFLRGSSGALRNKCCHEIRSERYFESTDYLLLNSFLCFATVVRGKSYTSYKTTKNKNTLFKLNRDAWVSTRGEKWKSVFHRYFGNEGESEPLGCDQSEDAFEQIVVITIYIS